MKCPFCGHTKFGSACCGHVKCLNCGSEFYPEEGNEEENGPNESE